PMPSLHRDEPLLLVFWSVTSDPTGTHVARISRLYRKYGWRGLDVLGVNLDRDRSEVDAFARLWGLSWPSYSINTDRLESLMRKYGIAAVPATYLITQRGTIVAANPEKESLERELNSWLPRSAGKDVVVEKTQVELPLSIYA